MQKYHEMTIAGCKRKLPLCEVNEHLDIAAFVMFGDVEITEACARELLKKAPEFDIMVTAARLCRNGGGQGHSAGV